MSSKHEFAVYIPSLEKILKSSGTLIDVQDQQLSVRLGSVLRLKVGEQCVFFDDKIQARGELVDINKKGIKAKIITQQKNNALAPKITFALPVLKKDDFETALYSLVELGANQIQLLITQKVQRAWAGEKEFERCQRIMIAAAEQSKNFSLPELLTPIHLSQYLEKIAKNSAAKVYFDVDGQSALAVAQDMYAKKPQELILMAGPEGDLTADERKLIIEAQFKLCALTPTILRSVTAVQLGLGIFRATLR